MPVMPSEDQIQGPRRSEPSTWSRSNDDNGLPFSFPGFDDHVVADV